MVLGLCATLVLNIGMTFPLIKKIHRLLVVFGLQRNEFLWFKSYLFNHKQFYRSRGFDSDIGDIDVGVPQGSCLGPLLFLIYINDLPKVVNASNVSMYTDDTSLNFRSQDLSQLNQTINNKLKHHDLWMQGNQLSLNVSKT